MPVIFQCFKHLWVVVFNLVYLESYFNVLNICLLLLGFFVVVFSIKKYQYMPVIFQCLKHLFVVAFYLVYLVS